MSVIINDRLPIASRRGIALLAVLCIIMAITVLALGFLSRADTELASGANTALRMEMDQLAVSGLEHARGLILQPQEAASDYWTGHTGLQLLPGSRDFYDVVVGPDPNDPNDHCLYSITSDAYRSQNGQRVAESKMSARLRLDPAFALWMGADTALPAGLSIGGDVYDAASVIAQGTIDGDIFAGGTITATCVGHKTLTSVAPVAWPFPELATGQTDKAQVISTFTTRYEHTDITPSIQATNLGTPGVPHVYCCTGDLSLIDGATVNGMLIVDGSLTIGSDAVSLLAAKNLPAVYVTGDLKIQATDQFRIAGLAVVDGNVCVSGGTTRASISGGLFVKNTLRETTPDVSGNACDGILYGSPTRCGGRLGAGALQFDGADDYVKSVKTLTLPTSYTLAFWINADPCQNGSATVLSKPWVAGLSTALRVYFTGGQLQVQIGTSGTPVPTNILLTGIRGGWHHVAISVATTTMISYLDGGSQGGGMLFGGGAGKANVYLGTNGAAPTTVTNLYRGALDDVRIYGCALTEPNVAIVRAGGEVGSPLARWRFDEAGAQMTIAADPVKAALVTWSGTDRSNWSPAAGAFFKQVSRVTP